MMKLIKSDAAIIAILTLLLFAFVKFQDASDGTVTATPLSSSVVASALPAAGHRTQP